MIKFKLYVFHTYFLKNHTLPGFEPGTSPVPRDMLTPELSWLGSFSHFHCIKQSLEQPCTLIDYLMQELRNKASICFKAAFFIIITFIISSYDKHQMKCMEVAGMLMHFEGIRLINDLDLVTTF